MLLLDLADASLISSVSVPAGGAAELGSFMPRCIR